MIVDQGEFDHLSEARLQLIRRFTACACLAKNMEACLARGEPLDLGEYSTCTSSGPRSPSPPHWHQISDHCRQVLGVLCRRPTAHSEADI